MAQILVVDDEEGLREFLAEALELDGHEVSEAESAEAAIESLAGRRFPIVVTDLRMPGMDGLELLRRIKADTPETEVVVLTAHGSVETAVAAMKVGAYDFLQKPIESPAALRRIVDRALERFRLRTREEGSRDAAEAPRLGYGSPVMGQVEQALGKVASTQATVLLTGESGTGKELAARSIHARSPRAEGPFLAVNCAALSPQLLESELFGHEKGAFTGATARRRGKLELCEGGTFFLDEVGELEPSLQAKLLRVLQEREFERVGGTQLIRADVRWVAATNRDLTDMMREGRFREDLYHRLAVFPIHLPPLRERREDIPALAAVLLERIGAALGRPGLRLSPALVTQLRHAEWPGNVRELANVLERAAILADGPELRPEHLILLPGTAPSASLSAPVPAGDVPLAELERQAIVAALARHDGNRKQVAEALGIGVRTLYDKIKRYEIG